MKKWMPWEHSFHRFSSKESVYTISPTVYMVGAILLLSSVITLFPVDVFVISRTIALEHLHLCEVPDDRLASVGMKSLMRIISSLSLRDFHASKDPVSGQRGRRELPYRSQLASNLTLSRCAPVKHVSDMLHAENNMLSMIAERNVASVIRCRMNLQECIIVLLNDVEFIPLVLSVVSNIVP